MMDWMGDGFCLVAKARVCEVKRPIYIGILMRMAMRMRARTRTRMSMTVKQQHHDPGQSKTQDESNAYVGVDSTSERFSPLPVIGIWYHIYYLGTKAIPTFSTVRVLRARGLPSHPIPSLSISYSLACLILFIQRHLVFVQTVLLRVHGVMPPSCMYMDAPPG